MLFRQDVYPRIASGEVTRAIRRWKRPSVKQGGTLKTWVGVLAIDEVTRIELADITDEDARASGYPSRDALLGDLGGREGDLYRITFHLAGPDPRIALREAEPGESELAEIAVRLDRLDRASSHGPWTLATLELVERVPATRAGDLAASMGRETPPFKVDVRKLKNLGLTESLGTGYRLSPRGKRFLEWRRGQARPETIS